MPPPTDFAAAGEKIGLSFRVQLTHTHGPHQAEMLTGFSKLYFWGVGKFNVDNAPPPPPTQ